MTSELNYNQLSDVHDGTEAQMAYLDMVAVDTPEEKKNQLEHALRAYCKLDTLAMVKLVHFFSRPGIDGSV